jgi:uroporphyrinogen-III synthase
VPTTTVKKSTAKKKPSTLPVSTKKTTIKSKKKATPIIVAKPALPIVKGEKVKTILVTQQKPAEGEKSPYHEIAKRFKVNITFQPFFEIHGITAKEFRRYRIHLHEFTSIIFTSRNAIDNFFRLLTELKVQMSSETKYFCTTESIALYLQKFIQYRKRKVFYGDGTTKDMLSIMNKHIEGESYLLPCSEASNPEIVNHLKKNKFNYTESVFFRTVPSHIKELKIDSFDMMVFFSPSAIEALVKNFPKFKQGGIRIGAFGSTTCLAVKDAKLKLHIEAPKPGVPSMAAAVEEYLKNTVK